MSCESSSLRNSLSQSRRTTELTSLVQFRRLTITKQILRRILIKFTDRRFDTNEFDGSLDSFDIHMHNKLIKNTISSLFVPARRITGTERGFTV